MISYVRPAWLKRWDAAAVTRIACVLHDLAGDGVVKLSTGKSGTVVKLVAVAA